MQFMRYASFEKKHDGDLLALDTDKYFMLSVIIK
jgi:hypothetical protein